LSDSSLLCAPLKMCCKMIIKWCSALCFGAWLLFSQAQARAASVCCCGHPRLRPVRVIYSISAFIHLTAGLIRFHLILFSSSLSAHHLAQRPASPLVTTCPLLYVFQLPLSLAVAAVEAIFWGS